MDLSPGQDYAVQFRSIGDSAFSDWSPVYRFRTDGDVTPPAPITNLVWRATGSSFLGVWDAVVLDGDGGPLKDFKDYEVTVTAGAVSKVFYVTQPTFELTLAMNADTFGNIAFTVQIDVKTRDQTGNKSIAVSATATEDTPPKPTTPVVEGYFGGIQVSWDGNPATGVRNDLNLDHVEIHASKTSNFTPSSTTLIGRFEGVFPNTQTQTFTNLDYGATYYIRLVAINRFGRAGVPSDQASAVPVRITNLDIDDNQISVDQINFTAYDIGGANAYYPATVTAMNAISNARANDIAYVTGSGYATYRYNGTTWVAAPEIGVIQGSKILAGTVTSNAVGTNLLITAAANIANAVIDDAKITSLDGAKINAGTITAGSIGTNTIITNAANIQDAIITNAKIQGLAADKITAGTINSTIIISGKFATASSGARREMNSVGFQAWDASNNQTVNIDGVSNLITGIFQTALTGRRIVVGASGATGSIKFIGADGTTSVLSSSALVGGAGNAEGFSMSLPITGTHQFWNTFRIDSTELAFTDAKNIHLAFGGTPGGNGDFRVAFATSKGNTTTVPTLTDRLIIDETTTTFYDQATFPHMQIGVGATNFWYPGDTGNFNVIEYNTTTAVDRLRFSLGNNGQWYLYKGKGSTFNIVETVPGSETLYSRLNIADSDVTFGWGSSVARIVIQPKPTDDDGQTSALVQLANNNNFGSVLAFRAGADGSVQRLGIRDINNANYIAVWATAFAVQSASESKTGITDAPPGALDRVRALKPRQYRRKAGWDIDREKDVPDGPTEIGLVAEEAHDNILTIDETGKPFGINVYSLVVEQVAAIQELAAEVDKLKKKGGGNK